MITNKITWWLWNQMFQYAYIKALSLKNKQGFKLDILWFEQYKLHKYCLEFFNIEKNYTKKNEIPFYENINSNNRYLNLLFIKIRWIIKRLNKNHHIEKQFNFDNDFLNITSWYIEWYFQTEKYFKDFENEIRKDFEFIIEPNKKNKETIENIINCNSVSLHIRRWDYVTNKSANTFHGTCNLDYYKRWIDFIKEKIENPVFFIFSDDMNWVKENLKIENAYYIDWNNADTNYEDMRLMSQCKHNIIANSSFSWWWAWLNNNKDKIVIAPTKWFNNGNINYSDVIPDSWIKI